MRIEFVHKIFSFSIFLCFFCFSDGSVRIGDEIVNINGESLRGQPYSFIQNLIATCTDGHLPHNSNDHVDLVICRSDPLSQQLDHYHHPVPPPIQFIAEKLRNKSVDTYFEDDLVETKSYDHHKHFTEFASVALK